MLMVTLLAGFIGCTKDDEAIPTPSNTNTTSTSSNTGSSSSSSTSGTTSGTSTVDKAALLKLVNTVRAKGCNCGSTYMPPVDSVIWNDKLEQAALIHSIDMTKNNYFDHTGSDGSSPASRLTGVGYQWSVMGENIAMGYTTEKAVVDAWLASEGHCKNIMEGRFTEMGVARDGKYWSQEFAKPLK
jgi:uncharacterized protein YkwD